MSFVPQRGGGAARSGDVLQRKHRPDYQIVLFTGLLMLLGLIIMYAIGPQRANVLNTVHNTDFYTPTYFVVKQLTSLAIAIAAFVFFARIPFGTLTKHGMLFVKIGFILCGLLFLFGNVLKIDAIATNTLGAYRWFNLGPLGTFQPAEVLKLSMLIFVAVFLGKKAAKGELNDMSGTVYPITILSGLALFVVVVLQKDMGTGVAMGSMLAAMYIVSGMSWKILGKLAIAVVVLALLATVTSPHRMQRVTTFFQGDNASTSSETAQDADNNYHIKNAMIALGTGGLLGLGIGNSVQATGYLPEAINDSIFAIMGETFGFIGATIIVVLFGALLVRLLRVSDHLVDMPMRLVVAGVFGWLAAHVILNIASMIGLMPLTGITLPLLSFGGTSMVFMTGALGLAYQLSRYTSHNAVTIKEGPDESTRGRRGIGGSRYSGARRYQRTR